MEVGVSDNTTGERGRRLRELLVTHVDLQRLWEVADRTTRRHELVRAASFLYDSHPEVFGPLGDDGLALCEEVATIVAECAEQLRPTAWAVRVHYDWWFRLGWFARLGHRLMGNVPRRVGGRRIAEWRAEPGTGETPQTGGA